MLRLLAAAWVVASVLAPAATAKGEGPSAIAVGGGGVWVGLGDGTVRRLDPRIWRVGRPIRVSWGPSVGDLAVGLGSVWAAAGLADLVRIDLRSGRVHEIFPQGRRWTASQVEIGRGVVWVGDYERNVVFQLDPRTERIVRSIRVPGRLMQIASGPSGLWAVVVPGPGPWTGPVGPRLVLRLYPRRSQAIRVACDQSLAVGVGAVWMSDQCADARLARVDADTGKVVASLSLPGPSRLALGFGSVWLIGSDVARVDPVDLQTIAQIDVGGFAAVAGLGRLWVLSHGDWRTGAVSVVDPTTNRTVGEPVAIGHGRR